MHLNDGTAAVIASDEDWSACREVARVNGRTFYFASRVLRREQRRAMLAAYAYCRIADDIVDGCVLGGLRSAEERLQSWEAELDAPRHPVARAFAQARRDFTIPEHPVRDLLLGVRMDLLGARYQTWEELRVYCYHVAGTVGLITAPILGCQDDSALPHAVNLGIAMQLTNILRDVAEDAAIGRIYIPKEDLDRFDVCEPSLLRGRATGRFPELIAFEIARARALYQDAQLGIAALAPAGQIATLASSHLYSKILNRIEEEQYDVLSERVYVPTHRKMAAIPTIAGSFIKMRVHSARQPTHPAGRTA